MSTANLTPEQQQVLNLIQTFERTGGTEGYLRHLEASKSTRANAPQINKNDEGLIYTEVDIEIEIGKPAPNHFHITVTTRDESGRVGVPVYQGTGYGYAPDAIAASFRGGLTLVAPGWEPVLRATEIPFKWIKSEVGIEDLIEWEACINDKAVMSFGGTVKGEAALVGKSGIMSWKQLLP
ncbi:hypothetical protein FS837_004590 [Tulasnella sp. UAMH 9824]|nr:hypothetical protein FS837_004590 [Tulasnella sp. UAMH 9824]